MRQEILLEIVDEMHGFIEQCTILATVHQDGFCTEHLRYLGEHGGATLTHDEVAEHAQERIGCDARESVGTAAFQSHAEFGEGNCLALVFGSNSIEFTQNLHAFLHFVTLHFLAHHEADALLVVVAEQFLKLVGLVVLASQTNHKHGTGIGVQHEVAQHLAGVLVVVGELRTAVVVGISNDAERVDS